MITFRKYIIVHNETGKTVFVTHATTEQAALDEYAAYRSGYDTLTEMARSATFRTLANVNAEATS